MIVIKVWSGLFLSSSHSLFVATWPVCEVGLLAQMEERITWLTLRN